MATDTPRFRGSGDDDEARWEAYRELLRRNGTEDSPDDERQRSPVRERRAFGPLTLEAAERAFADAEPDSLWSTETLRLEIPDDSRPLHARARRMSAGRNTRLVVAVVALTAGIVLAAALVPHRPHEPAVIAWSSGQHMQNPPPPAVAPPPTPAPTIASAPLHPAAPATAAPAAPSPMALSAVETTDDAPAPQPRRVHRTLRGETAERVAVTKRPSQREGALSCWLTQMNNGDIAGSSDAGLATCGGPPPSTAKVHGQD